MVDASDISKKARHWISEGLEGLGSYLKLKPLNILGSSLNDARACFSRVVCCIPILP